jgi:hypothetical protein
MLPTDNGLRSASHDSKSPEKKMRDRYQRSAAEIRMDFRILTVQTIPASILLEKLGRLRTEVHQGVATSDRNTAVLNEYLQLLADIERWSRGRGEDR